jgi:hypothetical protein
MSNSKGKQTIGNMTRKELRDMIHGEAMGCVLLNESVKEMLTSSASADNTPEREIV